MLDLAQKEVKRGSWGPHIRNIQRVYLGEFEALRHKQAPKKGRPPTVWIVPPVVWIYGKPLGAGRRFHP